MKIVAGLGNPGPKYDRTRHNVGYRVIDELSQRLGAGKPRMRFDATLAEGNLGGEKVLLTCPQTYMNESGRAVRQLIEIETETARSRPSSVENAGKFDTTRKADSRGIARESSESWLAIPAVAP